VLRHNTSQKLEPEFHPPIVVISSNGRIAVASKAILEQAEIRVTAPKREAKRVKGFFRAALLTSLSCSEPTDPLYEVENASMNRAMSGLHMARMSRRRSQAFRLPSNTWSLQNFSPTCIESILTVCEEEFCWVLHDSLGMSEMKPKKRCIFMSEKGLIAILLRLASRGTWMEHAALLGVSPTRLCHVFQTTMEFFETSGFPMLLRATGRNIFHIKTARQRLLMLSSKKWS
jgi:hypothetical protein